jgi:hypothetical protein
MIIEVVSTTIENKGKYSMMKVAYRANGKLTEKTLVSFGDGVAAYEGLSSAKAGDSYDVTAKKNEKTGYWDWVNAVPASATIAAAPSSRGGNTTPARSFETPEERAIRQELIVRQSSIGSAVEFYSNAKKTPTVAEVLEVATAFVDFVWNKKPDTYGMNAVLEIEDDIPY